MKIYLLFFLALFINASLVAQDAIKKVIVENYYISDANDATDTTGGNLETGSITYRVYIQMKPECKLTKIYSDPNHALKIYSTANFFNNKDRGKVFGKDITKSSLSENTAALDTWLTIGQTTTKSGGKTYFGILKSQDTDGSFIGGVNNDGGSAAITSGLLTNNDPLAGIPLTVADGMDTSVNVPTWQLLYGIDDTTIFGSKVGSEFISNTAVIQCSGAMGVNPDSNEVLVAQLTTKGEISFELNVEIYDPNPIGSNPNIQDYVAKNGNPASSVYRCPFLTYPPICGCLDKNYKEFNDTINGCNNHDSCKTLIVFGCMDPNACNYDPSANYNIQSLCCYPGMCGDRDISIVCPNLDNHRMKINVYPNPAIDKLNINISNMNFENTVITVYNIYGDKLIEKNVNNNSDNITHEIDLSTIAKGVYYIRVEDNNGVNVTNLFVKN